MFKFISRKNEVIAAVAKSAKSARIKTAEEVGEIAQSFAPEKTGELKRSKFTEHGETESIVGFSAEHALRVEFGTVRSVANPFFIPAMASSDKRLEQNAKTELKGVE